MTPPGISTPIPGLEQAQTLPWQLDPIEVLARWPADQPILMLHSGRLHAQWSRWSILATPAGTYRYLANPAITNHPPVGQSQWISPALSSPPIWLPAWTHKPFADLRSLLHASQGQGLWIGMIAYDLGRWIEQLPTHATNDRHWPLIELGYCPGYLVYDHLEKQWYACRTWAKQLPFDWPLPPCPPSPEPLLQADPYQSVFTRSAYEAAVQKVINYIAAGDVFQVNLAQRLTVQAQSNHPLLPRALYPRLAAISPAWYGSFLELSPPTPNLDPPSPTRAIASTSPELFLQLTPDGHVVTRPIKGTRPSHVDPQELAHSSKDAAELNMIVDLLRNDLGRVCSYGSMRVVQARTIESHPTVHHGVATVTGQLHPHKDAVDLLRATIPGGSITGAPKVRAMQIIDELEPVQRGPYCGCLGYLTANALELNITIRTMMLDPIAPNTWRIDFSVGGGIVADSQPAQEYEETLTKAAAILQTLNLPTTG